MRTAILLLTVFVLMSGNRQAVASDRQVSGVQMHIGTDDDALQNMISVYLNPSSGKFQLLIDDLDYSDFFEFEVSNTQGEIILNATDVKYQTSNEIDLSEHKKGLYFVTVSYNNKKQTEKIVVQ